MDFIIPAIIIGVVLFIGALLFFGNKTSEISQIDIGRSLLKTELDIRWKMRPPNRDHHIESVKEVGEARKRKSN